MKRLVLIAMVVCLLALGGQSFAELCTIDAVPAATLLLPNFKVDIGDSNGNGNPDCSDGTGLDTLFSINNASAAPALAHVTLWTDWSWPSLDFDVYLTGYDVQSVSLCQVIGLGRLPKTADAPRDPADQISPHGRLLNPDVDPAHPGKSENPAWDDTNLATPPGGTHPGHSGTLEGFPNCGGPPPFFPLPDLNNALKNRVQNAHAGFAVPGIAPNGPDEACSTGSCCTGQGWNGVGQCVDGACPGGTIARGYVTIDNVSACSTVFPNETGYFGPDGSGIANNINQLWGDYFVIDRANAFAEGDNLVHIEADSSLEIQNNGPNAATGYTFYGRYISGQGGLFTGNDAREPLGTTWGARYVAGFDQTVFNVWRDSTDDLTGLENNRGWACGQCTVGSGVGPDWCPLNETQVVCWDEYEDAVELCFLSGGGVVSPPESPSDPVCFPLEVNSVTVGLEPMNPPYSFGWCYLNLNTTIACPGDPDLCDPSGAPWPPGDGPLAQSYVSVSHQALGLLSVGYSAIELTSACSDANPLIVGNLGEP